MNHGVVPDPFKCLNKLLPIFGEGSKKDTKSLVFTFGWLDGLSGKHTEY